MSHPTTAAVYAFIQAYLAKHPYAPTVREIATGCHLAPSSVFYHLDRLEAAGHIQREPGVSRGLFLPEG